MPETPSPSATPSPEAASADPSHAVKTEISAVADQTDATVPPSGSAASASLVLNPVVGTMVGVYRLDQKLGEGGMGAVWKAYHVKLQKHVALKVLPAHFTRDANLVARFEREMAAVGRVDHPNVVRATDAGEFQGLHYLVMEFVDGTDLSEFVKARGPQSVRNSCELVRQAALGLAAAHKLGLVHRDIKPSNLFLTKPRDGSPSVVKILDLGLARLQGDTPASEKGAGLTGTGMVMGTPDYMAPEQWENTHTVDGRADLYALGCTLFCLLTGRAPYDDAAHSSLPKKILGHTQDPIPDLRAARVAANISRQQEPADDIHPELEALYRRLMAKQPEERVPTAVELVASLQEIIKSLGSGSGEKPSVAGTGEGTGSAASSAGNIAGSVASPAPSKPSKPQPAAPTEPGRTQTDRTQQEWTPQERTQREQTQSDDKGEAALPTLPAARPRRSGRDKAAKVGTSMAPRGPFGSKKFWISAGGLATVLVLTAIIFKMKNSDNATAAIQVPEGGTAQVIEKQSKPVENAPLSMPPTKAPDPRYDWPKDAPRPAIAPFDAKQAKKHQEEWAAYLKVPVEYTNSIGMKFRLIPPGEFLMGGIEAEIEETLKQIDPNDRHSQERIRSEAPRHRVKLTKPIYLGIHEVTQGQFERVAGKNPSFFSLMGQGKDQVAGIETTNHPVETVRWNDVAAFCAQLSMHEKFKPFYAIAAETVTAFDGTGYRLPTEAEWEFACRAGTTTRFWAGDQDDHLLPVGWCERNADGRTHAVGELRANPFGLYDIHGNVFEWVQDAWEPAYYGRFKDSPAIDPQGSDSGRTLRAIRGGYWGGFPSHCRSSYRWASDAGANNFDLGFRVSLTVDAVKAAIANGQTKLANATTAWNGWPADAPKPAIAPFDASQAKKHQEEWAAYLKIPVEHTNSIGMKFRLIPPGEFTMGSTKEEIEEALKIVGGDKTWQGFIKSEAPQHKAILTRPIYLGIHEVTQAEYKRVMDNNPSQFAAMGESKAAVAGLDSTSHPVEMVSWNDAAEFCARLSDQEKREPFYFRQGEAVMQLEGTGYRLPTEAEWEYACRAGTATKYWLGDKDEQLVAAAWIGANVGGRTHVVEELKANPFGLFDVHGNVWEWVQDWWEPAYYGQFREKTALNPKGPNSAGYRVMRGGGWLNPASACRASSRFASRPTGRNYHIGFRVLLEVVEAHAAR